LEHEVPDGPLVRFHPPLVGGEKERRQLTIARPLARPIHERARKSVGQQIRSIARTHFGQFVKGAKIDDCLFMKRVEDRRRGNSKFGHEVWSVSPRFKPQHRYFGMFAGWDHLAIFRKQPRDYFVKDPELWHVEIDECLKEWSRLFPGRRPYSGTDFSHYVTNGEHCDDRW